MIEHIKIRVDKDGQAWVHFDTSVEGKKGRQALLNLNNIVLEMNPKGFTRETCIHAIAMAVEEVQ